jgi:Na+-driven multidrug efflux pump
VNLGVAGAALATLISRIVGAALMLIIAHNKKRYIHIEKLLKYRPDKKIIKALLSVGIPNGIENSLFQFGRLMTSSLVSSLGTVAIAANAAALSLANFQYNAGGAIHSTMVAVVGRCIGAKEREQAKKYAKILLGVGYATIITVAGLLCLLSSPLLGLFNLSTESFETAQRLIFFHSAVSAVIWAAGFCLPNALRAAGDIRFTMVVSVVSMWLFRVAFAYVLAQDTVSVFNLFSFPGFGMGVIGVWIAMFADWIVRTLFFLWRFLSGKWLTKAQKI